MKHDTSRRKVATVFLGIAALMLCALPAVAQGEDSEADPAQQGGHYEAESTDGEAEAEEAPAPIQHQPAARARAVPRVFRARPGGIRAEPNRVDASVSGDEEAVSVGGIGLSQGAADRKPGSRPASGGGGGGIGGFSGRPLGSGVKTPSGGGSTGDSPNGPRSFPSTMSCEIKDFDVPVYPPKTFGSYTQTNFGTHSGQNNNWIIPRNGCISLKFTAGKPGRGGKLSGEQSTIGRKDMEFWNISRNPGDFAYSNLDENGMTGNGCAVSEPTAPHLRFEYGNPAGSDGRNKRICYLAPGQTYFINIRNENPKDWRGADACNAPDGRHCGGLFQVHEYPLYASELNGGESAGTSEPVPSPVTPVRPAPNLCNALKCSGGFLILDSYYFSPPPPTCAKTIRQACSPREVCLLSRPVPCGG